MYYDYINNEGVTMNKEILRQYYFAEKVQAKKRWIKTRMRLKQKLKSGTLGEMALSRKSVIMKNGAAYEYK